MFNNSALFSSVYYIVKILIRLIKFKIYLVCLTKVATSLKTKPWQAKIVIQIGPNLFVTILKYLPLTAIEQKYCQIAPKIQKVLALICTSILMPKWHPVLILEECKIWLKWILNTNPGPELVPSEDFLALESYETTLWPKLRPNTKQASRVRSVPPQTVKGHFHLFLKILTTKC